VLFNLAFNLLSNSSKDSWRYGEIFGRECKDSRKYVYYLLRKRVHLTQSHGQDVREQLETLLDHFHRDKYNRLIVRIQQLVKDLYSVLNAVAHGSCQFAALIEPTKHYFEISWSLERCVLADHLNWDVTVAREGS